MLQIKWKSCHIRGTPSSGVMSNGADSGKAERIPVEDGKEQNHERSYCSIECFVRDHLRQVGPGSELHPAAPDPVRHRGTDSGADHAADSVCLFNQQEGEKSVNGEKGEKRYNLSADYAD